LILLVSYEASSTPASPATSSSTSKSAPVKRKNQLGGIISAEDFHQLTLVQSHQVFGHRNLNCNHIHRPWGLPSPRRIPYPRGIDEHFDTMSL
jgi:hypothetical protein